jgi:hypothetical protein
VNELCDLPTQWWGNARKEEAPAVAADLLMSHLGQIRGVQYDLLDRPDQVDRQRKAPDYRYKCRNTGEIVVVEHKRFVKAEDWEASSHLEKGKRFGPKGGIKPMEHQGEQWGAMWGAYDPQAKLDALRTFIVDIIGRGQLQAAEAKERLLLIQDEQHVSRRSLMASEFSFTPRERDTIDHVFLLSTGSSGRKPAPSKIIQVW